MIRYLVIRDRCAEAGDICIVTSATLATPCVVAAGDPADLAGGKLPVDPIHHEAQVVGINEQDFASSLPVTGPGPIFTVARSSTTGSLGAELSIVGFFAA
jgi:hypothetical protein